MAGAGARFTAERYGDPKPLIPVSGLPMVVQAARSLPSAEDWVFICRREHIDEYRVDGVLREHYPSCRVLAVDGLTPGQAVTCALAQSAVHAGAPLVIGACDNGMVWDRARFEALSSEPGLDAVIWTFRGNVTTKRNPHMYGWVRTLPDGTATGVSCKTPISDDPMNDHAIIGTFYFREARTFFEGVDRQIDLDRRVNGEFYVDVTLDVLIEMGRRVKVFEVDKYVCWGTPNDLRTFEYWESHFEKKEVTR